MKVMMEKQPDLTVMVCRVFYFDTAKIEILVKINGILTTQIKLKIRVGKGNLSRQCFVGIS